MGNSQYNSIILRCSRFLFRDNRQCVYVLLLAYIKCTLTAFNFVSLLSSWEGLGSNQRFLFLFFNSNFMKWIWSVLSIKSIIQAHMPACSCLSTFVMLGSMTASSHRSWATCTCNVYGQHVWRKQLHLISWGPLGSQIFVIISGFYWAALFLWLKKSLTHNIWHECCANISTVLTSAQVLF